MLGFMGRRRRREGKFLMEKLFRHMSVRKVAVISLGAVLILYVVGSLGVDFSWGPDELVTRAVRSAIEDEPEATPTAAPTPTPITTARWALVETIRSVDAASSVRFETRVSRSDIVNRGIVVRPSLAAFEVASERTGEVLALVRLIDEHVYVGEVGFSGPDAVDASTAPVANRWLTATSMLELAGLVHMDPRWFLTESESIVLESDSEIVMDGLGERWHLSGLVSPEFARGTGYSWEKLGDRDYPVQYLLEVNARTFLPFEITLVPYPGTTDVRMALDDYDVAGELPQAPTAVEDSAALSILIASALAASEIEVTEADGEMEVPAPKVVSSDQREDPSVSEDVPALVEDGLLRMEVDAERAGWRRFDLLDVGVSLALPETWVMALSNGTIFVGEDGDVVESGMRGLGESLVGSLAASGIEPSWVWLGWDALASGEFVPFVLVMGRDYEGLGLKDAAASYRSGEVENNVALVSEAEYSTFVSDSGAVCAMGRYLLDIGFGRAYGVSDCLLSTIEGYVSIMVGTLDAELSDMLMATVVSAR